MSALSHLYDPMSGRQYPDAAERTVSGARPVVPSRGFDVEAGTEDRARADACCDEFAARMARHAPIDADDGTYDESGTVKSASSVGGWCLVVVIGLVAVASVVYAVGAARGWWSR